MRRILPVVVLTAVFLVVAAAAYLGSRPQEVSGMPRGGDFTLQSADGPVTLSSLRGSVVLVYFGYASCPDVCPTALGLTAQALAELTPQELERVRVLFVSVDPERDTPELLKLYAAHFHRNITGVTASPETIAEVTARYGAAYRKQEVESAARYVVDHTSFTTVVAPDGRLVEQLPHGAAPADVAQAIRRWL
jgi:protein SCO1/2